MLLRQPWEANIHEHQYILPESLAVKSPVLGGRSVIEKLVGTGTPPPPQRQKDRADNLRSSLPTLIFLPTLANRGGTTHSTVTLSLVCTPEPGPWKALTKCVWREWRGEHALAAHIPGSLSNELGSQ